MQLRKGWYPEVFIPNVVAKFCSSNPLPLLKEKVGNSSLPSPPKPPEPLFINYSRYIRILLFWLAGLAVLLVSNYISGFYLMYLLLAIASETALAAIFVYREYQQHQQRKVRYQKRLAVYCEQLVQYEYEKEKRQSQLKAQQSQLQSEQFQRYQEQILWRQQCLRNLLVNQVIVPSDQKSAATEGISEESFYSHLKRYFPGVRQSVVFTTPNSFNYTADFVIPHKLTGLAIDCEIDEPYVLNTGQPHHCQNNHKDYQRNQFFLENNWAVIRFSEWQALVMPDSCCKLIAFLIYQVTGDDSYWQMLLHYPDLELHKQWTPKEAERLAKAKFRHSYFTPEIHASLAAKKAHYAQASASRKTKKQKR